jgi:uncharacterized protein (DUF2384 family)
MSEEVRRGAERASAEIRRGYERASEVAREGYDDAAQTMRHRPLSSETTRQPLRRRSRGGTASPLGRVRLSIPGGGRISAVQAKTAAVIEATGGKVKAARLLGVARSQPGRWLRGEEAPSPDSARRLVDLDYVLSRLEQLYEPPLARRWLSAPNAFLEGARPVDVLRLEGPGRVVGAIDATIAGSYA